MSTSKTLAALAAPIAGALAATAAAPAAGQTSADRFSGTAAGFVVARRGLDRSEITPGENATNTFVGPMSAIPGSPVTSTSPDGSADASTSPGVNRVFADSRGDPLGAGEPDILHYSGSYWGDVFTFTGGVGPLRIILDYDFDGVVNDARGNSRLGAGPPSRPLIEDGTNAGEAAVRFRSYVGGFSGNRNLNPSVEGPDFFLNLATDQNDGNTFDATFDVPSIDDFDPGNGLNDDGSLDNITFAPADPSPAFDPNDPNDPELIAGPYATNDDGPLRLYGSGARFDWTLRHAAGHRPAARGVGDRRGGGRLLGHGDAQRTSACRSARS